jgi:hypothetical protein
LPPTRLYQHAIRVRTACVILFVQQQPEVFTFRTHSIRTSRARNLDCLVAVKPISRLSLLLARAGDIAIWQRRGRRRPSTLTPSVHRSMTMSLINSAHSSAHPYGRGYRDHGRRRVRQNHGIHLGARGDGVHLIKQHQDSTIKMWVAPAGTCRCSPAPEFCSLDVCVMLWRVISCTGQPLMIQRPQKRGTLE